MAEVSDAYMIRKQREQVGEMCFPRSSELVYPLGRWAMGVCSGTFLLRTPTPLAGHK